MNSDNTIDQVVTDPTINQTSVPPIPSTSSKRKYWIITGVVSLLLLVGAEGFFMGTQTSLPKQDRIITNNSTSSPQLNLQAEQVGLKVPFVRNGNIYIYENGQETLISAKAPRTQSAYGNIYPSLSPNGKYLAYIAVSRGPQPGQMLIPEGPLNIYTFDTRQTIVTKYQPSHFQWNKFNQLEFETSVMIPDQTGQGIDTTQSRVFFIVYNPETKEEVASQTMSYEKYNQTGIQGMPLYSNKKLVELTNDGHTFFYALVDKVNNKKRFLTPKAEKNSETSFSGWSPDGKYVIFTKYDSQKNENTLLSIDTESVEVSPKEIARIWAAGAGGSPSTGLRWYFNKGFVVYCKQSLFFVDGSTPSELTKTGGGGCHDEEGFVATSPNNEYAFVKFGDRFELHTKEGMKTVIREIDTVEKTRFSPRELIWVNNDYMVIYDYDSNKRRIYLFDRKQNTIKRFIENASFSDL